MVELVDAYEVLTTDQGVRCGNHHPVKVRHANTASVRACYQLAAQMELDNAAEIYAEGAWLRRAEMGY